MSHEVERRRERSLVRAPAVTIATSVAGMAVAAFVAKPMDIDIGDITFFAGPLVSVTRPGNIASSAGVALLWRETFDDSLMVSRGWYDQQGGPLTIDPDTSFRGTGSMRVEFSLGGTGAPWGGIRRLLGDTVSVVGVQARVKFDTNWQGSGASFNPHNILLLTDEDSEFSPTAFNRSTFYVEHNYVSGTGIRGALRAGDHANINESFGTPPIDLTGTTEARSVHGCNGIGDAWAGESSCFNEPPWKNFRDFNATTGFIPDGSQDWHLLEAEIALNSVVGGIGQADGSMRMWIDSVLVIDRGSIVLRTGQYPDMGINQLVFSPFMQSSPANQVMWVDDLAVCSGARCSPPPAVSNFALSFPGVQDALQGRARVLIATNGSDPSRHQLNVGNTDLTFEWWLKFAAADVTQSFSGACDLAGYGFTSSQVFLDNDRIQGVGAPSPDGGYGGGVFLDTGQANRARVIWSMRDQGGDVYSVCSDAATDMGDDAWHHYLVQWETSTGQLALYVDGVREGYSAASGVGGDVSLDLTFAYGEQNPYFVLGNEKHGTPAGFAFEGEMDELRVSTVLRQPSWPTSFTAPTSAYSADVNTAALFHFNNTAEADSAANEVPIPANPETWTNKLQILTGVTFVTSRAPTGS